MKEVLNKYSELNREEEVEEEENSSRE